jgi:hypothetical protein
MKFNKSLLLLTIAAITTLSPLQAFASANSIFPGLEHQTKVEDTQITSKTFTESFSQNGSVVASFSVTIIGEYSEINNYAKITKCEARPISGSESSSYSINGNYCNVNLTVNGRENIIQYKISTTGSIYK